MSHTTLTLSLALIEISHGFPCRCTCRVLAPQPRCEPELRRSKASVHFYLSNLFTIVNLYCTVHAQRLAGRRAFLSLSFKTLLLSFLSASHTSGSALAAAAVGKQRETHAASRRSPRELTQPRSAAAARWHAARRPHAPEHLVEVALLQGGRGVIVVVSACGRIGRGSEHRRHEALQHARGYHMRK